MALLSTQQMAVAGTQATYSAVSASDTADISNGRTFAHVVNAGASSDTVTVVTPGTVAGLAIADLSVTVPNGQNRFIGPLDPQVFGSAGVATIQHSYLTSVTIAILTI